jgi:hypothetical protein
MSIILDGTNGETFPSWTTAGRPSPAATGQTGYNLTTATIETYNGTTWVAGGLPTPSTSGNLLTSDGTNWVSANPTSIGVGQTWQNFTTSTRVMGTTYTNSTGKPIMVILGYGRNQSSTVTVGGVTIGTLTHDSNNNTPGYFSFIVPNGATYANTGTYSSDSGALYWSELR